MTTSATVQVGPFECVVDTPALLGESPLWHPREQCLYWCDIPGHELRRWDPATGRLDRWSFDTDVACCAPIVDGGMLLGLRSGLWFFDPATGERRCLSDAPYDPAKERYNDGKADPLGRFWSATIYEPRQPPLAALYCYDHGTLSRRGDGVTVGNGLAWSPNGRTLYWSDTTSHTIRAYDFDLAAGTLSGGRDFARFPLKTPGQTLDTYGGRPDGAAMDSEGCLWSAMFEGQRLVRLAPDGQVLQSIALPVRCPTMPCFGGHDLRTLYVTSARHHRPAEELAAQPWAGCIIAARVDVPGLPAAMVSL